MFNSVIFFVLMCFDRLELSGTSTMIKSIHLFVDNVSVHKEFAPRRQTFNEIFSHELIERFRKCFAPGLRFLTLGCFMIISPCHTALCVLASKYIPVISHPRYSPDLILCNFISKSQNPFLWWSFLKLGTTSVKRR